MNRKVDAISENGDGAYRIYDRDNPAYQSSRSISSKTSKKRHKSKKEDESTKAIGIGKLFSYSTTRDKIMIFVALLSSVGQGITWPLIILVFGQTTDLMSSYQIYLLGLIDILRKNNITVANNAPMPVITDLMITNIDKSFTLDPKYDVFAMMNLMSQYFAGISLGMLVLSYLSMTFFVISSQNQTSAIRKALFRAILRQNIGWFDEQSSGALNNKLIDDINKIHAGIGDRVGQMVQWFTCCIAAIILAFYSGWKLTLVTLSVSPLTIISMLLLSKVMMSLNQKSFSAYGKAGGIAEEVLGSVRTVVSFRGEKFEVARYSDNLFDACRIGIKKSILTGTLMGLVIGLMYGSYSLGFWYGSKLINDGEIQVGQMLIIFFSCMNVTNGIGQATPHLGSLNDARNTAAGIFEIIDRVPEIDKMSSNGKKIDNFKGNISFKNVNFKYPTRLDCPILCGLSLDINAGQTIALVGASGCGKSSLIQLIQRFYDVDDGELLIDGVNITALNIKWLREQIGVVSQEPVLFGYTIRENIRYGRMDVTEGEIQHALIMSNAKSFIDAMPDGLETMVGDRGFQLSGGQKQRIAIARALVRNPKILLLDEATSALDSESERIVQEALDKACSGRTTVIVAHRLSTVRNADIIFGIKDGRVLEKGTHEELIAKNGLYKELVDRQRIDQKEEIETHQDSDDENEKMNEMISPAKSLVSARNSIADEKIEVKGQKKKKSYNVFRVMKLNGPEKWYIVLGCFGSVLNGATQPAFSILFGYLIPAMANSDVIIYIISMAVLGVVAFLANVIQNIGFSHSGEHLTRRCRGRVFEAMLKQNIGWFDLPENNIGALTTRLSDETSALRGLSGESLGALLQGVFAMSAAVVISFVYCWQIALIILAFVPVILLGGILQVRVSQGQSSSDKNSLEESGKVAVECIENVRTVSNLTREEVFIGHYNESINKLTGDINKKGHLQGILFGASQSAAFCAFAGVFVMAGYLLKNNMVNMTDVYVSFGALIFGSMNLGRSMAMAPDVGKGKSAANHIFELLDREPPIDSNSKQGVNLNAENVEGSIDVRKVKFSYPLRPHVIVMNGVSFEVEPNKTIALVGPSGCGKSTIIQLLQRFYDVSSGSIYIDNTKIPNINIQSLRKLFSIVSQEPTLFSYSIKENIAYADVDKVYKEEQIIQAAKAANIHDFIMNLPDKYDTKVGEKGSNFSGGQKQRIAIARALLHNPRILLLDEATSALDTESEKVVQDALEKAQEGRTCLVIAHRLSTIQNADKIIVFKDGKIAEVGTHLELLNKNGIYSQMIKLQSHK